MAPSDKKKITVALLSTVNTSRNRKYIMRFTKWEISLEQMRQSENGVNRKTKPGMFQ